MTEPAYLVKLEMHVVVWPAKASAQNAAAEAEVQMHNAAEDAHAAAVRAELPVLWHLNGVRAVGTPKRAPEQDRE